MSKLYGCLHSDKGVSTRAGHQYIRASAQSYEGSVTVELKEGMVRIYVTEDSCIGGTEMLVMPLDKLIHANGLTIKRSRN